jgi:hypothetical protein
MGVPVTGGAGFIGSWRWRSMSVPRWLPGMHIKRWLVLLTAGITLLALSAGYFLRVLYEAQVQFPWWVYYLTLQFWPREVRGALFLVAGGALVTIALLHLNRTLIGALLPRGHARVIDLLDRKRRLRLRHDPARLAHAIICAWNQRTQGRQRGSAERRAQLA